VVVVGSGRTPRAVGASVIGGGGAVGFVGDCDAAGAGVSTFAAGAAGRLADDRLGAVTG
jgi:hypothetical protein